MPSEVSAAGADQHLGRVVDELKRELEAKSRELAEAREQQAASAEILAAISSSPTDPRGAFERIAASAARLCEAYDATIHQVDGGFLHIVAHNGPIPVAGTWPQAVIAIENARLFEEVQARTRELARSVEELRALGDVSQAVNSSLELETVLSTIVAKAVQLSGTDAGTIYVVEEASHEFHLRASYGMDQGLVDAVKGHHLHLGETAVSQAALQRKPVQLPDVQRDSASLVLDVIIRAGFRALLADRKSTRLNSS